MINFMYFSDIYKKKLNIIINLIIFNLINFFFGKIVLKLNY
jgi:hypothetical protein